MDPFIIRLFLSFIVAGTWVTLATVISERFGSKIGGLIGNLPANILVSMFFIGWINGPDYAAQTAITVESGMALASIYMFVLIALLKRHKVKAFLPALLIWFISALLLGSLNGHDIWLGVLFYFAVTIPLFWYAEKYLAIKSVSKSVKIKYGPIELGTRALIAGGTVTTAVAIATLVGPSWGGIAATFPAVMTSTIWLMNRSQGADFARAVGKVMLLSSLNVVVYILGVHYLFPLYGIVIGTILSYALALAAVLFIYPLMKRVS
jgi:hypothetical protein